MFDGQYFDWNQKRIKGIVDFYGYKFFYFKRLLDLGCGYGDLGGVLYRLGADVTGVDVRQEHLKVVNKKYSGIKTVQANLDDKWPFHGQKFDLILDLGLLCHLADYEKHLNAVCASCTHLVLETAVCDSDDPYKVIQAPENKGVYDLSHGGMGCRPGPAAIERVLKESGMNFKRMDNQKFNSGDYSYDWYPRNDNSTNLGKRRIWFCVKESSPIQFANPGSELAYPPITVESLMKSTSPLVASQGYITPEVGVGVPPKTAASPKPPMSARMEAEARARAMANNPQGYPAMMPGQTLRMQSKALSLNDRVRQDSREFSLITPDNYSIKPNDISGIVLPTTPSSRMWFKKIAPFLPNLKLSSKALSMTGFSKTQSAPSFVMCSLDNLCVHNRIFIDEWVGPALTEAHVNILKQCNAIMTPSLLNAQEIWRQIPHASVSRFDKPWPGIETEAAQGKYFLYFEKSAELTGTLLQAWDPQWGDLVVVGSSIKLPTFARFISDTEPYPQIMKLVYGAKGLVDLSENNYYASGILNLARDLGLPIISNNHSKLEGDITLVQNDRRVSFIPTIDNVKEAISKFNKSDHSKVSSTGVTSHNNMIIENIRKLIG